MDVWNLMDCSMILNNGIGLFKKFFADGMLYVFCGPNFSTAVLLFLRRTLVLLFHLSTVGCKLLTVFLKLQECDATGYAHRTKSRAQKYLLS